MTPILEASGLRVVRGAKSILRGVTLRAGAGEIIGILGPSGAGKSTLFRALVGDVACHEGIVRLNGRDISRDPLWRRARAGLGYVPQEPSVLWDLTVAENLRVYRRIVFPSGWLRARDTKTDEREMAALAQRVALETRLDVRAGQLSGGERRRLELARALARPPEVLICDEPFAGVDPKQAHRLGDMLRALASTGMTVLFADHHVAEALRICSRAILLLDGEIALDAAPLDFAQHPVVEGRYLGTWHPDIEAAATS